MSTTTPAPAKLPAVTGYLADNWNADAPALVLNPAAAPVDLLAWCWAEIASLNDVVDELISANPGSEDGALRSLCQYRLPAVRDVLEHTITGLIAGGKS